MPTLNKSKEQGIVYVPILIAAIALIGFIFVSSSADFKSNLFGRLFPNKPKSHASETSKIELIGNLGVGRTSSTQTYTPNIQARLTYIPPVPSPTPVSTSSASPTPAPITSEPAPAAPPPPEPAPVPPSATSPAPRPANVTKSGSDGTWCLEGNGTNLPQGSCQDQGGTYNTSCRNDTMVNSYYCTGTWNGSSWSNVKCEAGGRGCGTNQTCSNGSCISTQPSPSPVTIVNPSPVGVGGSVQGVAYAQGAPVLPSGYRLKTGISPVEARDLNGATFVPFNVSEWQAPTSNQSGYTKVINLQLPGGFGQKYAALQFMVNGAWQSVLLSAPINFIQAPSSSASPSTGEWRTITVPLTKGNSNFNPTGVATIQMSSGIVDTSAGVATVIYKFKFISLQIRGDQPNTWFYPRLCGSVANRPFCADLSQPPTGGQTDSSGNLTFNYPSSSFQYRVDLPLGQTTANLGVFSSNQQAYCGRVSMESCTLKGTIDLSQLVPQSSPAPTPSPIPPASCPAGSACVTLTPPAGSKTPQGSGQIRIESQGKGYKLTGNLSNLGVNKQYRVQLCKDGGTNCASSGQMQLRTDQRGNASLPTAGASVNFNPNDNASFYNIIMVTDAGFTFNGCNTSNPCLRGEFSGVFSNPVSQIPEAELLCKADVNGDGFINVRDFSSLTPCTGKKPTDMGSQNVICSYADLNNDGTVNEKDVNDVIKPRFGKSVNRSTCGKFYSLTQLKNADVNRDGRVTLNDSSMLQGFVNGAIQIMGRFGDINSDNKITKEDADDILRIAVQRKDPKTNQPYTAEQKRRADVDGNGAVSSVDALFANRFAQNMDKVLANKGDVNGDKKIDFIDIGLIVKIANNQPLY